MINLFELRNETEVWYKSEEMFAWVHYGNLIVVENVENNKYAIKKFDFDKNEYVICTDFEIYEYEGTEYQVTDGYFEIDAKTDKEEHPNNTDVIQVEILLNQAEIIAKQKEHDEVLAELLLGQQGGV